MATGTKAKTATPSLAQQLQQCMREDKAELVERNEEVELIYLCLLAMEHPLFIGIPGVAKSMTLRLLARHVDGARYFERLVFKQTPAEELLGPVSLKALEQDKFERNVSGKLPDAHLAFVDEVFKAPANVLNSMLKIINERQFDNNGGAIAVPLWTCGFASNELPGLDRDDLRAFRDRIVVTKMVHDVRSDDGFKAVLRGQIARRLGNAVATTFTQMTVDDVNAAITETANIDVPDPVMDDLARLRRMCMEQNLHINPRRFGAGVKLMQAKAYLAGRDEVLSDDIKVFQHVIWREPEDEQTAYRIVLDFASEFERAAAKYQDEYDPIKVEFQQLVAKGSIDPNDQEQLGQAIRVKRLLDLLGTKVEEKLEAAEKDGRDASALAELATSIQQDKEWVAREAFGINP
jgi:MoxR-like ATPase